jgi:hypothetical protein
VTFRVVLLFLCFAAAHAALAHSEGETSGPGLLDCEHPPQSLVKMLPEAVAKVASDECNPSVQAIAAGDAWSWRYPGSFFDRPIIPAYAPMDSHQTGGPRYFTAFKATEFSVTGARKRHEMLAKDLPTYLEMAPPARLVKLLAHNDLGHELDAYFGFCSDGGGWVGLGAPECLPEHLFLMQKID